MQTKKQEQNKKKTQSNILVIIHQKQEVQIPYAEFRFF